MDRNTSVPHNTEDKLWWYQHGENLELQFVNLCSSKLGLNAAINPEKTLNPHVPDLIVEGQLADLKTQNTPFFSAARYGVDPRFAVTFNRKDYERYKKLYPNLIIYFWLDWKQTEWSGNKIEYFGGIFKLPFPAVAQLIEMFPNREHFYKHRTAAGDKNAKSSFVLDIRKFEALSDIK